MPATITVSKSAIFELIMAGLEAYAVEHDANEDLAIETGAHLWGYINKTQPFKCRIDHVSVETSAERKRSSVAFAPKSLQIKKDIASVFGDQYQYIGTAHSHPYLREDAVDASVIRNSKLYELSKADHKCEVGFPEIEVAGKLYSVALILTVHSMLRANDRKDGTFFGEPLVEFSLGNIKFWLYGRVFEHKSKNSLSDDELLSFERYNLEIEDFSDDETLPIPKSTVLESSIAWDALCSDFGRLKFKDSDSEYNLAEVAERRW